MKILANDKTIEVSDYEDDQSILNKYSMKIPDSLPSYFKIVAKTKNKYEIDSILLLLSVPIEDLRRNMSFLLSNYPNLDTRTVVMLWSKVTGDTTPDSLMLIDSHLSTPEKIKFAIKTYEETVANERESIKEKLAQQKELFEELDDSESVEQDPFILEQTTITMTLDIPNGESLLDIFDILDVSKDIPFILLEYEGRQYYKIYRHIVPPDTWLDFVPYKNGIYFKVLHDKESKIRSKISIDKLFSDGVWGPDNSISLDISITGVVDEEKIKEKLFKALGNRIEYSQLNTTQSFVKGFYDIRNFSLNRAIFADMILNDKLVSYFFFTNEKNKSILRKQGFTIYYLYGEKTISKAMTISFNILQSGDESTIEVKLSRAKNIDSVEKFRNLFSKILGYYDIKKDGIIAEYEDVIPDFMELANVHVKRDKEKESKKTGERALKLRQAKPDMFVSQYPDQCQQESQPYIVNPDDKERLLEQLGDPHKLMEYQGDTYACEPRLKSDTSQRHVWPGLQPNKLSNRDVYPYLPCCFKRDQYVRKKSALNDYLASEGVSDEKKAAKGSYILSQLTFAKPGQYIYPPLYLKKMLSLCDFKKVMWQDRGYIIPIVRVGISLSHDSLLRCFATVFDEDFRNESDETSKAYAILQLRETLASSNFAVCKQELYDYTYEDISSYLLDQGSYIDSLLFINLLNTHYDCNSVVVLVDENANCSIEIPRHSQAYLLKEQDENKPMVVILKYARKDKLIPYTYELLGQISISGGKLISGIDYLFTNTKFKTLMTCASYEANNVYMITYDSISKEYSPNPQVCIN